MVVRDVGRQQPHMCRELVNFFFSLIGQVRFVSVRPTMCYGHHSVFAKVSQDLHQNWAFVLVLLFVSCVIIRL